MIYLCPNSVVPDKPFSLIHCMQILFFTCYCKLKKTESFLMPDSLFSWRCTTFRNDIKNNGKILFWYMSTWNVNMFSNFDKVHAWCARLNIIIYVYCIQKCLTSKLLMNDINSRSWHIINQNICYFAKKNTDL